MARTECYHDPSLDARYPTQWPAEVSVTLRDGRHFTARIEHASGEPEHPVSRAALVDKFGSLAGNLLPAEWASDLAERILHLDEQATVTEVLASLRG